MRFLSTKNTLGKIKNVLSTLTLGFLVVGTAQAEIIDFQAEANECNADLTWTTDANPDVVSFDVQKSLDGVNFTDLINIRVGQSNTYEYSVRQTEERVVYRIIENHDILFQLFH